MKKHVKIEVVRGVGGNCLLLNDYRVCGPEPTGGGTVIETFSVDFDNIKTALDIEENASLKEKYDNLIKHRSIIIDHAINLEKEVTQLKEQIKKLENK
jgi:hypothetical protein